MSLFEKLKEIKPAEVNVEIGDMRFIVRGMGRSKKNEMMAACTSAKGKLNGALAESRFLAACVCDESGEQVQPDHREWDIAAHVAAPLIKACVEVCGLDEDEAAELLKKSHAAEDCD